MSQAVDREQLRRDLSDALQAIQKEHSVVGLDVLAGSLSILGGQYAFHGRLILKGIGARTDQLQRGHLERPQGARTVGEREDVETRRPRRGS